MVAIGTASARRTQQSGSGIEVPVGSVQVVSFDERQCGQHGGACGALVMCGAQEELSIESEAIRIRKIEEDDSRGGSINRS
ncbi:MULTISPECIES: hypothetical protein [unclassified Actinoplanes]|uniref:hypothetical protein n=1 Tax=unclassified Actinoplanes TaxID=2626549 RepID=UPI0002EE51E2|nr:MULTISPECIES: hypothetical protein [unclassified Actinoplanes]